MLLYINGQLADLDSKQVIAQTKQVNDLNSLDNRQTSYTNKFRLPKTANNIRIMGYLSLAGNDSEIPYQKNECSLYSDNGECFVYNGWAVVTDGGDSYEAVIYDGIIDLYKAIENKTLSDLNLSELVHEKNTGTVVNSWESNSILKYKYILADFNGKTTNPLFMPYINIDYMVPSVKVAWLWDKIFTENEFGYNGAIFDSEDFNNLWITYPKGITSIESEELLFSSDDYSYAVSLASDDQYVRKYLAKYNNADTNTLENINNIHLRVPESGRYKLEVSGKLKTKKEVYDLMLNPAGTIPASCNIFLGKNAQNQTAVTLTPYQTIALNQASDTAFIKTFFLSLSQHDTLCLAVSATQEVNRQIFRIESGTLNVKLTKVEPGVFDFNAAFSDFSMRDFLNEIVHRYGLTMYKEPNTNSYTFLTLKELLQESAVVNWSDKFIRKTSESYTYPNYAQQNWLRYNYNEKESDHNDGYIPIVNKNLPESRNSIKSKIYSPEKNQVNLFGRKTNVYKLWEKEIVENPEPGEAAVTYKPLDKRYYFLREEIKNGLTIIKSELLNESVLVSSIPVETFANLSFKDIAASLYEPMRQILDSACIVTAEMLLKDNDITNFDFKKRYYIEQLGASFIINKITNYVPGKPVKCELIKVKDNISEPFAIKITKVVINVETIKVYYTASDPVTGVVLDYDPGNEAWMSLPLGQSPVQFNLPPGDYKILLRANGKSSNNVSFSIPDIRIINIP